MKTLIVIRHAHREKIPPSGSADNGLSAKGRKQAKRVRKFFSERYGKAKEGGVRILSSPKLRCIETLEPLAKALGTEIEVSDLLDEGSKLEGRVRDFLSNWLSVRGGPELTVISSHGDWIPVFLRLATGARAELDKGGWAELREELGAASLTWLVQEL